MVAVRVLAPMWVYVALGLGVGLAGLLGWGACGLARRAIGG